MSSTIATYFALSALTLVTFHTIPWRWTTLSIFMFLSLLIGFETLFCQSFINCCRLQSSFPFGFPFSSIGLIFLISFSIWNVAVCQYWIFLLSGYFPSKLFNFPVTLNCFPQKVTAAWGSWVNVQMSFTQRCIWSNLQAPNPIFNSKLSWPEYLTNKLLIRFTILRMWSLLRSLDLILNMIPANMNANWSIFLYSTNSYKWRA